MNTNNNGNGTRTVVGQAISGLKGQPVLLALMILNVVFVVAGFMYLKHVETERADNLEILLKACVQTHK